MHRLAAHLVPSLFLTLAAAACGDDTGGAGSGGGGGTQASTSSDATAVTATTSGSTASAGGGGADPTGPCFDPPIAEEDLGPGDDPEGGDFTLDEALEGLPVGPGPLRATIATDLGDIVCELDAEVAPLGVANFVGLARGRRPFLDEATDTWVRGRPFYDGLSFHRVIDDFVAQGGDPRGNGTGGPGYELDDEIGDLSHVPGALAYANSGEDTNGSQFYIVAEVPVPELDGGYTLFGLCEPVEVVKAITELATSGADVPVPPFRIRAVRITRCDSADAG